ncbi:MAG: DUF3307 domain-containing protein [Deltaproteobacteria bacterium]|nr:MAG: DUF3307 domain-containing protein [Deltaproteobacteria bacterium]
MTLNTFLLLLLSHVLGDVVFTSYRLAVLKRNSEPFNQILAIGCHAGVHAFFAGLLVFVFGGLWLKAALLVLALHFLIDFLRCRTEIRLFGSDRIYVKRSELFAWISGNRQDPDKMRMSKLWPWFLIHFLDQGAHLGSLYGIALVV